MILLSPRSVLPCGQHTSGFVILGYGNLLCYNNFTPLGLILDESGFAGLKEKEDFFAS
jgi:hypothetical protein